MSKTNFANVAEEIAYLREQNAKLTAEKASQLVGRITAKVQPKGTVSVYGLGRFPVTLFPEQWAAFLGFAVANAEGYLSKFLVDNHDHPSCVAARRRREAGVKWEDSAEGKLAIAADAAKGR